MPIVNMLLLVYAVCVGTAATMILGSWLTTGRRHVPAPKVEAERWRGPMPSAPRERRRSAA
jgi:hypothetical protein